MIQEVLMHPPYILDLAPFVSLSGELNAVQLASKEGYENHLVQWSMEMDKTKAMLISSNCLLKTVPNIVTLFLNDNLIKFYTANKNLGT